MAVIDGNETVVRYLVGLGADVNAQGSEYGDPLQAASYRGHEIIVRYLVKHGADVNAQGGEYGNALSAAEANGNNSIVRFLLEKGASRNSKDGGWIFDYFTQINIVVSIHWLCFRLAVVHHLRECLYVMHGF
jgi:ankyrin repeat protein